MENKEKIFKPKYIYRLHLISGEIIDVMARSVKYEPQHIVFYQTIGTNTEKLQKPFFSLLATTVVKLQTIGDSNNNQWENLISYNDSQKNNSDHDKQNIHIHLTLNGQNIPTNQNIILNNDENTKNTVEVENNIDINDINPDAINPDIFDDNLNELESILDNNDNNDFPDNLDNLDDFDWEAAAQAAELEADIDIEHDDVFNEQENNDARDLSKLLQDLNNQINGQDISQNQSKIEQQKQALAELLERDLSENTQSSDAVEAFTEYQNSVILDGLPAYLKSINRNGKQKFVVKSYVDYLKNIYALDELTIQQVNSVLGQAILEKRIDFKPFENLNIQEMLTKHKSDIESVWLSNQNVVKLYEYIRLKIHEIRHLNITQLDVLVWLIKMGYIKIY